MTVSLAALVSSASAAEKPPNITFKQTQLDAKFRSEGVAVGDFNTTASSTSRAGSVYYAAPDWKMHPMLEKPEEFDPHRLQRLVLQLRRRRQRRRLDRSDRRRFSRQADLVVRAARRRPAAPWKRHECTPVTNNESPQLSGYRRRRQARAALGLRSGQVHRLRQADRPRPTVEVDSADLGHQGAGHRSLFARHRRRRHQRATAATTCWCSKAGGSAGRQGAAGTWTFHPVEVRRSRARKCTSTISTATATTTCSRRSAHQVGIWWHEQTPDGWKTHEIDDELLADARLCLADINGDGLPDFVTGKRWWAHGPRATPGPTSRPCCSGSS